MHWHLYFTLLNCTAVSLSDTMLHKWAMPHGFCNRHMNTVEYVLCFMACCTSDCNSANFNPLQPLQRDFSIPIIWVYVMAQQACLRMVSCDSVFVVVTLSLSLLPGRDSLWVPTFGSRTCRTSTVPTCAQLPLCSCHYLWQWSCATRHWIVVRLALVLPRHFANDPTCALFPNRPPGPIPVLRVKQGWVGVSGRSRCVAIED